ncbi:hypothetical protein DL96DRAFT_1690389 [Flagelloscypha sp. PMI_526]|nr:hypothetical protein DL96DRAFT_1690389 [Flagelloscypha sp. PMI_526]
MTKTVNNAAAGTFTATGGDVTIIVGDRIDEGTAGIVFKVNCGADVACKDLGPVILKFYKDNDQVGPEQQHLAKIDELKAVSTGPGDQLTLTKGFSGTNLSKTQAYLKLTEQVTDKTQLKIPAITKLVKDTAALVEQKGLEYLTQHEILHLDINDANVLVTESEEGKITAAELIDWDKAVIVPAAEIDGAKGEVTKQLVNFNRLFETPETEKKKADADAVKKPVKPAPRPAAAGSGSAKPAAPAAAPGSAKPAAPVAAPAAPVAAPVAPAAAPPTPPAAARPAAVPRPAAQAASVPPPSAGRPAVPGAAPANRRP